jgi:hypothetical protein
LKKCTIEEMKVELVATSAGINRTIKAFTGRMRTIIPNNIPAKTKSLFNLMLSARCIRYKYIDINAKEYTWDIAGSFSV